MITPTGYSVPDAVPEPTRPPRRWGVEFAVALAALAAVAALGAPVGALWSALAPRVLVQMSADGPFPANGEPEEYFGGDGAFTLISLGVGIVLAVLAWLLLRRWRGAPLLLGLTVGSLVGAILSWQLGQRIGLADYKDLLAHAQVGWQFYRPPTLRAVDWVQFDRLPGIRFGHAVRLFPRGALAAQALAVVFTYTMIAGWSRYPALRPTPEDS